MHSHLFTHTFIHPNTYSLILTRTLIHPHTHSLTLIHPHTYSLTHLFTHTLIHSHTYSLTHFFTHTDCSSTYWLFYRLNKHRFDANIFYVNRALVFSCDGFTREIQTPESIRSHKFQGKFFF